MNLHDLTLHELHDKLRSKDVSSVELTQAILSRIESVEPKVSAFIAQTTERALADAIIRHFCRCQS